MLVLLHRRFDLEGSRADRTKKTKQNSEGNAERKGGWSRGRTTDTAKPPINFSLTGISALHNFPTFYLPCRSCHRGRSDRFSNCSLLLCLSSNHPSRPAQSLVSRRNQDEVTSRVSVVSEKAPQKYASPGKRSTPFREVYVSRVFNYAREEVEGGDGSRHLIPGCRLSSVCCSII